MKRSVTLACVLALLVPLPALAYDPAPDLASARVLGARIDGDVAQGIVSGARAALLRAEIAAAQRSMANDDAQATEMLADIDRDLAVLDLTLDANEAGRDLLYHVGDKITIALRDGVAWQVEKISNPDLFDLLRPDEVNATGVQGVFLAKDTGTVLVTLLDPSSGRRLHFSLTFVMRATS